MKNKVYILASLADSLSNFRGDLIREIRASGYEVIASSPATDTKVLDSITQTGAKFVPIPLSRAGLNPFKDLGYGFRLWRALYRHRPTICLAYTIKPVIFGMLAAWLAGVPTRVALITGLGYAFVKGKKGYGLSQRLAHMLYRLALGAATKVIFQNPDDRQLFVDMKLVAPHKCALVNGSGVNLEYFTAETPKLEGRAPVFLMIARLLQDKGVREYAQAAKWVRAEYPQARFQLAGWLDENPNAISRAELDRWQVQGDIEYLGKLDDVREAIRGCDVYVLPSYREGTPRSVLEAMAMSRPIITTDAPGCRETVVDGVNGFKVEVANVGALADTIQTFIHQPDLVNQLGQGSLTLVRKKFDVKKVNKEMLKLLGIGQ